MTRLPFSVTRQRRLRGPLMTMLRTWSRLRMRPGNRHQEGKHDRLQKGKHRSTIPACGDDAAAGRQGCLRCNNFRKSGNYVAMD